MKKYLTKDQKHANFKRVFKPRIANILTSIQRLDRMTNKRYFSSLEERQKIIDELQKAVDELKAVLIDNEGRIFKL